MAELAPDDGAARGGLTIQRGIDAQGLVLALAGELDLESAPELERHLADLNRHQGRLLIDLSGLDFMDSSGLSVIVHAHRLAQTDGHRLALRRGPSQVQRLFELTGVSQRLTFEE
jgi:anti-sigma B factor antagonist